MPHSIGSAIKEITGKLRRPPSDADCLQRATDAYPPSDAATAPEVYQALFVRLARDATVAYRMGQPKRAAVTPEERALISAELTQLVGAIRHYLKHGLGLREEPHLDLGMHPSGSADAISISARP